MPVPARKLPGPATTEDLLAMPEEGRYEIVDGELIPKEAASGRHGQAQTRLGRGLGPFDYRPGGPPDRPGGWRFASEVLVEFGRGHTRRPDVSGWRRERLPEMPAAVSITVLPDWVCEILSTHRAMDQVEKMRLYHRSRVAHYWIIDPEAEMLTVHRWHDDGYLNVLGARRGDRVRAEPFEAIELFVGGLFGDDDD